MSNPHDETIPPQDPDPPCYNEIALSAYFVALERNARGEPSDPFLDWIEAERELKAQRLREKQSR